MDDDRFEEREALREACRTLLSVESSSESVRALMDDPIGYEPGLWKQMAELGWMGLIVPESYGGADCSFEELGVVLEELGRHVTPAPFLWSAVLSAGALLRAGTPEQRAAYLPRLSSGELIATVALCGAEGRYTVDALDLQVEGRGSAARLRGRAGFVPDAHVAGLIVVAARESDGAPSLFLLDPTAAEVSIEVKPTVDQTRRLCDVQVDGCRVGADQRLGEPGSAAPVLDVLLDWAATGLAADCAGGARRALEISVEYAKTRVQFGRPIGSFQAIKHRCADLYLLVEAAATAAQAAASDLSQGLDSPLSSASIAKAYAADAYSKVAADSVLVHGALGFTWEHDMHLFLKRAKLNQQLFGSSAWHRERLLELVLPEAG